ncbi:putative MFS-type transporter [Cladophialophora carrionii]|uniref:Putative MFS-type transporter n=1 Tax=Cladophialophora carrionii TaxID=86049 RepID=A0A1C1CG29_9EURO|nr:putative MFS-type transporter [Cladophialophora carrionii]
MSIDLEKPATPTHGLEHGPPETRADGLHGDQAVDAAFESPFDLPTWRKWVITTLLALMTTAVTFASSIWSATIAVTSKEFDVSETVSLLGVSLYVLGFSVGPIVWVLQIPIGVVNNLPALLVCRLLAGCFGASPQVLVGATYADFWEPADRGVATAVYSVAVYVGPTLGPIFGALLTESSLGWHWTGWLSLMLGVVIGIPAFLFVPETYSPILQQRANRKSNLAQDSSPLTEQNDKKAPAFAEFVHKYMFKPAIMFCVEPMLMVMALYIAIVYGILYLTFFAFPYSFVQGRGWDPRTGTLPFLSILTSVVVSSFGVALYSKRYYRPRLRARGSVLPEDRLPLVMLGSIILPIGLFFFAWTSSSKISPVPQIVAGFFIGSGIMLIFTNAVAFLVDIYLQSAASAMAASTIVRSLVAAGFPLAAPRMYKSLGTAWATSVLGFLCVLAIPAPFLFYKYGRKLRQMSRFAPVPE